MKFRMKSLSLRTTLHKIPETSPAGVSFSFFSSKYICRSIYLFECWLALDNVSNVA